MLALLIGSPFLEDDALSRVAAALLLSILMFATVMAASEMAHHRLIAATLATLSGASLFTGLFVEHRLILLPIIALLTVYMVYAIGVVLRRMVVVSEIDPDILCGAVAIYLLIGVVWAMTYWFIYEIDASAFSAASNLALPSYDMHQFLYYSFSTLTSLGMGDITPVNRFAQIWTTLETVTGNLYIAVLVARLVSLYR